MGILEVLTILFIGLKLAGFISWSWWAVLAPMWAGYLAIFTVFSLCFLAEIQLEK